MCNMWMMTDKGRYDLSIGVESCKKKTKLNDKDNGKLASCESLTFFVFLVIFVLYLLSYICDLIVDLLKEINLIRSFFLVPEI